MSKHEFISPMLGASCCLYSFPMTPRYIWILGNGKLEHSDRTKSYRFGDDYEGNL